MFGYGIIGTLVIICLIIYIVENESEEISG